MLEKDYKERQALREPPSGDDRGYFDVDYARIIHSASFRRLQGKTQVLNLGDSDFCRTRLTHSIEVSQIAEGITLILKLNPPQTKEKKHAVGNFLPESKLIAAIGAAHDLGHPPFGHSGEVALNYCMQDVGGFEGNGQTLRILTRLESTSKPFGTNLARRTLLGCLKYPIKYSNAINNKRKQNSPASKAPYFLIDRQKFKPPKCYLDTESEDVAWILKPLNGSDKDLIQKSARVFEKHHKPLHHSLDCSIMNLADDISYGVHDLEDAIRLHLVSKDDLRDFCKKMQLASLITEVIKFSFDDTRDSPAIDMFVDSLFGDKQKHYIGRLVHYFIMNVEIRTYDDFAEPLLKYRAVLNADAKEILDKLKKFVREKVIFSPSVQQLEFKGQRIVIEVFEILKSEPDKFLPLSDREKWDASQSETEAMRVICDYVAGMTDDYLLKTYERLSSPRMGSFFDKF